MATANPHESWARLEKVRALVNAIVDHAHSIGLEVTRDGAAMADELESLPASGWLDLAQRAKCAGKKNDRTPSETTREMVIRHIRGRVANVEQTCPMGHQRCHSDACGEQAGQIDSARYLASLTDEQLRTEADAAAEEFGVHARREHDRELQWRERHRPEAGADEIVSDFESAVRRAS